jgi:lipopolysaccharide transport system permease protein
MINQHEKITIYSAQKTGKTLWSHLRDIRNELPQAHELGLRLFQRNLRATYRQSFLGFLWVLLPPLMTAALWIFLKASGVIKTNVAGLPYTLFVLIGIMLWQIFTEALLAPIQMVNQNKAMLSKINIPREGLILACFYEQAFNLFIKILVIGLALLLFWQPVSVMGIALALLGTAITCAAGLSIGLFVTPIGMLYQDVTRTISIILPFLMYLSPIVYDKPKSGLMAQLMPFNPMAVMITQTRQWFTLQHVSITPIFIVYTLIFLLLLFFSLIVYRLAMPMIIERMGS